MNNENNEINEYDFCIDIPIEIYENNDLYNYLIGEDIDKNQENNIKNNNIKENIKNDIESNTLPKEDSKIFYETKNHYFPHSLFLDSYFSCSNCFVYIINIIKYLYGCITSIIKKPPNIISMENSNKNET
jgi:hypothetical protein